MKKLLFLFTGLSLLTDIVWGQEIIFPSDKNIKANAIVPMVVDNDVIGYYACILEDMSRKMDTWNLLIMDINFKIIRDVKFETNGEIGLKYSLFNGSHFCFAFSDNKSILQFRFYNFKGDYTGMHEVEDLKALDLINKMHQELRYIVPFAGMIRNGHNPKNEKYIECLNNEGDVVWRKRPRNVVKNGKESGTEEEHTVYYLDSNYLILQIHKPGLSDEDLKKQSNDILSVCDIKTGKEIFEISNRHAQGFLVPLSVYAEKNQLIEFGQFFPYDKSGAGYEGNSCLGMYTRIFDRAGQIQQEYFYDYKDSAAGLLNWKANDPAMEKYDLWIHEVIRTTSGKYYVIGEIDSVSKLKDMIVFEFSSDFKPVQSYRYEKENDGIPGFATVNDYKVGLYMESSGAFDYRFTSRNADKSLFNSVYLNENYSAKGKKEYIIEAIGLDREQKLVNPKIPLKNNPNKIIILPAKTGYVAVIEFNYEDEFARLFLHKFDL